MKKWIGALLALALCLALAACGEKEPPEVLSPEQQEPAPSIDGPVYEGSDVAGSPFVGAFVNAYSALFASDASDVYVRITEREDGSLDKAPLDKPKLVCKEDGTFTLTVCTAVGEGYATLNGSFTVDGETAQCTVAQGDYGDFIGSDTQKFSLRLTDKDTVRYWGDQIGTVYGGDIFEREG